MGEILITSGIVIALGATLVLLVFAIKQWHMRQRVKDIPIRYNEWLTQYKTKRGYILLAQLAGIIIAIIGLSV